MGFACKTRLRVSFELFPPVWLQFNSVLRLFVCFNFLLDSVFIFLSNSNVVLTWCVTVVGVVVAAVAEGMLEYTLDVVKLEPADRKCFT